MAELRSAYEDLVGGISQTARQRIRDSVATYTSDLLPGIDQRLLKCDALLRRGLRDEALGYAHEDPPLANAANLMNLERFGRGYRDWMEASRNAGILPPASPRMDLVKNLVDAEQAVSELSPLLATWRRLNLARAPLKQRIEALRALRARDGTSAVWPEAIQALEGHHVMEIGGVIARIKDQWPASATAVAEAERELAACVTALERPWAMVTPPKGLLATASATLAQIQDRCASSRLDELGEQFATAYQEFTAARCPTAKDQLRRINEQWLEALAQKGAVAPDDPRIQRVKAATDYIERLAVYDSRMAEVAQSLTERPVAFRGRVEWSERLGRMLSEIDDAATRLPAADIDQNGIEMLADRVDAARSDVQGEVLYRRIRTIAAAAAVIVVIAGAGFTAISMQRHDRLVGETLAAVTRVRERVQTGEVFTVPDIGKGLPAALSKDARITAAFAALDAAVTQQEERRKRFVTAGERAKNLLEVAGGEDRPDPLSPWPSALGDATRVVEEIRGEHLAVTAGELAGLARLEKSIAEAADLFVETADDVFLSRIKKLEAGLVSARSTLRDAPERIDTVLAEAEQQLEVLRRSSEALVAPGAAPPYADRRVVSKTARAQVDSQAAVVVRLNDLRAQRDVLAGLGAREARADAFLAQAAYGSYSDILREMAESLGTDPLARDYSRVADDVSVWQAIAEWNDFLTKLGPVENQTSQSAAAALDALGSLKPEVRRLSFAIEPLRELSVSLEQSRDLTPAKVAGIRVKLEKVLRSMYGTRVDGVVFQVRDDEANERKQYYCLRQDRPLGTKTQQFKYVVGWPDQTGVTWPTRSLRFFPLSDKPEDGFEAADAPQKLLALKCLAFVERLPAENARTGDLARALVAILTASAGQADAPRKPPLFDPCLHAILLRYVLLATVDGHPIVRTALTKAVEKTAAGQDRNGMDIQIRDVDNEAFADALDPEKQYASVTIRDARRDCIRFIEEVRQGTERAAAMLQDEQVRLAAIELPRIKVAGRLRKLRDGAWAISGGEGMQRQESVVYVLRRSGVEIILEPVGLCGSDGQLPSGTKITARAGDPVFLKQPHGTVKE